MAHPKIIEVVLAALAPEPCFAEPTKSMEAHTLFVESHRLEPRRKPALFKVVVQVWRAVSGLE